MRFLGAIQLLPAPTGRPNPTALVVIGTLLRLATAVPTKKHVRLKRFFARIYEGFVSNDFF
jgi:hypothetical protein